MMRSSQKVIIATQHYPPDQSTTAAIMSAIACHLVLNNQVVVLSGTPGLPHAASARPCQPVVINIRNRLPEKAALFRRAVAELLFALRIFFQLLRQLRQGDVVLTVTAPFIVPYVAVAVARLKRARSALIMHDFFPDALVMAGLLKPHSIVAQWMRAANTLMFRALSAIVTIGRDAEALLLTYRGVTRDKIHYIPNWATLPPWVRPNRADNPYRRPLSARYVVGLSGNLGFTHDPEIVFEAARSMREQREIHFLLSGWGIGFARLQQLQSEANLPNVTLIGRVGDEDLEQFLSAADIWIVPYRKDVAGVSVPSRFYNLLAVGRPVILVSEPDAEAALTVRENKVGWVVPPGRPDELAKAIRAASCSGDLATGERAVGVARAYDVDSALSRYSELIQQLLANP